MKILKSSKKLIIFLRTVGIFLLLSFFSACENENTKTSTKPTKKERETWRNSFLASEYLLRTNTACSSSSTVQLVSGQTITKNNKDAFYKIPITKRGYPNVDVTLTSNNCRLFSSAIRCYNDERIELGSLYPPIPATDTYTVTNFPEDAFALLIHTQEYPFTGADIVCNYTIHVY